MRRKHLAREETPMEKKARLISKASQILHTGPVIQIPLLIPGQFPRVEQEPTLGF